MGIAPVMHGAARNIFPLIFFHTYPFISYEKSPNVELGVEEYAWFTL